jgi:hypothetical protein
MVIVSSVLNPSVNAGIQNICDYFIRPGGKVNNNFLGRRLSVGK